MPIHAKQLPFMQTTRMLTNNEHIKLQDFCSIIDEEWRLPQTLNFILRGGPAQTIFVHLAIQMSKVPKPGCGRESECGIENFFAHLCTDFMHPPLLSLIPHMIPLSYSSPFCKIKSTPDVDFFFFFFFLGGGGGVALSAMLLLSHFA